MADFVQTLGLWAKCPLHMFETNAPPLCADEAFILGLIVGIQNDDDSATNMCLTALSYASCCKEIAMAAGSFALILKGARQIFAPISEAKIAEFLSDRNRTAFIKQFETPRNTTIH